MFMEIVGIIASLLAAIAALLSLFFTVRNSKGSILKRIDKKQKQILDIDNKLVHMFGINGRWPKVITPLDIKRSKLQSEINDLQRKL